MSPGAQIIINVGRLTVTGTPSPSDPNWLDEPCRVLVELGSSMVEDPSTGAASHQRRISSGEDEICLVTDVLYQEASKRPAIPYFEMDVTTPEGEHVQTISATTRDIKSHSDDFRERLELRVPRRMLVPGSTTRFVIGLEARLDFYSGSRIVGSQRQTNAGMPMSVELVVDDDAVIDSSPVSESALALLAQSVPSGPIRPSQELGLLPASIREGVRLAEGELEGRWSSATTQRYEWKTTFNVQLQARILPSDAPATVETRVVERGLDAAGVSTEVELPLFTTSQTLAAEDFDGDNPIWLVRYFRDRGDWKWFDDRQSPPRILGPYSKEFVRVATLTLASGQTTTRTVVVTVSVPDHKTTELERSRSDADVADRTGRASLFASVMGLEVSLGAVGAACFGIAEFAWMAGPYGAALALGLAVTGLVLALASNAFENSSDLHSTRGTSRCDREFDPAYGEVLEVAEGPTWDAADVQLPEPVWRFFDAQRNAAALCSAIDTNFTRYLSARKVEDADAAERQRAAIEDQMTRLVGEILALRANHEEVAGLIGELASPTEPAPEETAEGDTISPEAFVAKLRESGLGDELRSRLVANGVPSATIERLEQRIPELTVEDLDLGDALQGLPERVDVLLHDATERFFASLEIVRDLRLMVEMPLPDVLSELQRHGILSFEESLEIVDQVGLSYPLSALQLIPAELVAELDARGIDSTADLLRSCASPRDRRTLGSELPGDVDLLWLANIADLLRINDLHEDQARQLEAIGVDTVKELARRNPTNLRAAWVEATSDASAPPLELVVRWIERAGRLRPSIEY